MHIIDSNARFFLTFQIKIYWFRLIWITIVRRVNRHSRHLEGDTCASNLAVINSITKLIPRRSSDRDMRLSNPIVQPLPNNGIRVYCLSQSRPHCKKRSPTLSRTSTLTAIRGMLDETWGDPLHIWDKCMQIAQNLKWNTSLRNLKIFVSVLKGEISTLASKGRWGGADIIYVIHARLKIEYMIWFRCLLTGRRHWIIEPCEYVKSACMLSTGAHIRHEWDNEVPLFALMHIQRRRTATRACLPPDVDDRSVAKYFNNK